MVAETYLKSFPVDEQKALLKSLLDDAKLKARTGLHPDEELATDWREGSYPYKNLMSRKNYEKQKYDLQVELLKLQAWTKQTGSRVVIYTAWLLCPLIQKHHAKLNIFL